ncbi:uncharacterized protein ABDE67_020316 [Symphorus nematophorus]
MSKKPNRPTANNEPPAKRSRTDPSTQTDTSDSCPQESPITTEGLLNVLDHLAKEEFEDFKWRLQQGRQAIPRARLERAERRDTVTLMVQNYTLAKAVEVTKRHLKKMKRNDLVQNLYHFSSEPAEDDSDVESSSQTPAAPPPPPPPPPPPHTSSPTEESNLSDSQPANSGMKPPADDPHSAIAAGGSASSTVSRLGNSPPLSGLDDDWGLDTFRMDQGRESMRSNLDKWASVATNSSRQQSINSSSKFSYNNKTSVNQSQSSFRSLGSRLLRKWW